MRIASKCWLLGLLCSMALSTTAQTTTKEPDPSWIAANVAPTEAVATTTVSTYKLTRATAPSWASEAERQEATARVRFWQKAYKLDEQKVQQLLLVEKMYQSHRYELRQYRDAQKRIIGELPDELPGEDRD